ncbi:porin [Paraburkholderia sp. BCC1884]|uniref:porin n=1 Tax=Paraburkholderia sp. BCC1884 TaxID=2562668 RepID=UPI001182FC19|nr:porin [Paraburkholderia sp. BCC1884]
MKDPKGTRKHQILRHGFSKLMETNKTKRIVLYLMFAIFAVMDGTAAHAQSSVTLYGVADASLRYLTGADKNDDAQFLLANGAISQSRWGLHGQEGLGGGTYAVFDLQNGFNITNGTLSSSGVLFNRNAYVGIGNHTYGLLKIGEQDNPVFQLLFDGWDPLAVGNYFQNEWLPVALSGALRGERNMALYTFDRGPLTARGSFSLGGVAGDFNSGSLKVLAVAYNPSPFGVEVGFVQGYNATDFAQTAFNVQLRYRSQPIELWAGYYNSVDHTGSVDAFLMGADAVPSASSPRKDNAFVAGAAYAVSPTVKLTGAAYYDSIRNIVGTPGSAGEGKRFTYVALAEYFVSRSITVYATADYNRVTGAASDEEPNGQSQFGAGTGIRYRF